MQIDRGSRGEVHLEWTPAQENDEYSLVHTVHHATAMTVAEGRKQTITQPPKPATQQFARYKLLVHCHTLAEHSIQPYTDIT